MDGKKAVVNACAWLIRRRAKIKALHPQQMQGKKKSPAISDRVKCFLFGRFKQRRKKPKTKQD
jgi:hypothetical protein